MNSCTKQCGHVDIVLDHFDQIEQAGGTNAKVFGAVKFYDYLSNCNCSRLYGNKKFMHEAQYKLDYFYKNGYLEKFQNFNVDMCSYAIKMFGDHILNCKCNEKCTRSGKKY
jgi:hypothetical protein